ncbi:hypothetical protein ABH937_005671 [Kitasatospora sp. GAS1066B]
MRKEHKVPEYPPSPTRGGLLVAVEVLASVHDRHDSDRSDPGTGSSGDGPWPDGDGLNNPA